MYHGEYYCPKDCPERSATCHASCERYQDKKKKVAYKKQLQWNAHKMEKAMDSIQYNSIRKGKK